MSDEIKQKIVDYLSSQFHLSLATVTAGGIPLAHTVTYASEGATIYFVSDKTSRKMQNIMKNGKVAYTVDE
jgi:nitroimidazol reductase NimA-like FMN-containing flavoprotein (pyridoxamine 5'-phosphate oxidase superfamily)